MSSWLEAVKVWNGQRGGKWMIPKKGTPEYEAVKAIQSGFVSSKAGKEEKKEEPKRRGRPSKAQKERMSLNPQVTKLDTMDVEAMLERQKKKNGKKTKETQEKVETKVEEVVNIPAPENPTKRGRGRPRKPIDFSKLDWGSFTRAMERYIRKTGNKEIKNLSDYAEFVLANRANFPALQVKKAQFYKNIIKKGQLTPSRAEAPKPEAPKPEAPKTEPKKEPKVKEPKVANPKKTKDELKNEIKQEIKAELATEKIARKATKAVDKKIETEKTRVRDLYLSDAPKFKKFMSMWEDNKTEELYKTYVRAGLEVLGLVTQLVADRKATVDEKFVPMQQFGVTKDIKPFEISKATTVNTNPRFSDVILTKEGDEIKQALLLINLDKGFKNFIQLIILPTEGRVRVGVFTDFKVGERNTRQDWEEMEEYISESGSEIYADL